MEGPYAGPGVRIVWQQTTAKSTTEAVPSLALHPDGIRLAVASGTRVLLYDTGVVAEPSSSLLATLKAHKDAAVTSIDWSGDGQRFASGSDDGKVVVWSSTGQGLLKYGHQAAFGPVLQVAHEPCPPHRLCSITARDVAIWTPGTKAVRKERLGKEEEDDGAAALTCVAWSPEGRHLAVAFADGSISLLEVSSNGSLLEQRKRIERHGEQGNGAVLGMVWTGRDTLVVGRDSGVLTIHRSVITAPHTRAETVHRSSSLIHLRQGPGQYAVLVVGDDGSLATFYLEEDGVRQRVVIAASLKADAITAAATTSGTRGLVASATRDGRLLLLAIEPLRVIDREEDEGKEAPSDGEEAAAPSSAPKSPRSALEALMAALRWEEALALAASAAMPAGTAAEVRWRQARWHLDRQEWRTAVDALIAAGEHLRAVAIVGEYVAGREDEGDSEKSSSRWWPARIVELARSVNVNEAGGREVAQACARLLAAHDSDEADKEKQGFVREAFLRLEDVTSLLDHLTRRQRWSEVGAIARERPGQFDIAALVPYAGWLAAERGKVDEAVATLWVAGGVEEARRLLRALIDNAVVEGRFHDASYGHWVLAVDALQRQPHTQQQFLEHSALADLYAAYQHVHAHVRQPFTALAPHTLLQAASCVLHSLSSLSQPQLPPGVSTAATLYVLATQADRLGAHATARQTYDALDSLHLPRAWRDAVGVRRLELRAGSSDDDDVEDPPEFLPLCYRCGLRGPLLARPDGGDRCQGCGHPFIRSMLTFEVLPLVEFAPDLAEVTTAEEALALLWAGVGGDDADGGGGEEKEGARRFNAGVARTLAAQQQQQHQSRVKSKGRRQSGASSASSTLPPPQYTPVLLGLRDLQSLRREEVFVVQAHRISSGAHELSRQQQPLLPPAPLLPPCRYYRNVLHPDVPLVLSQAAGRFCGEEAFEAAWLLEQEQDGTREWGDSEAGGGVEKDGGLVARRINPSCPFSRVRSVGDCG